MNIFYSPTPPNNGLLHLPKEEADHCIRVLRMKKGDTIFTTDGNGNYYETELQEENIKNCLLNVKLVIPDKNLMPFKLSIAIAPTKSIDRFEWFLEKVTEIGCDEIIPIRCRYSERNDIKIERLNKILISSMKQCLKSKKPRLLELSDFKKFIVSSSNYSHQKFIGHIPELKGAEFPPQNPEGKLLQRIYHKGNNTLITIGPEGGFSNEEVSLATENGFTPISLGNSRLRVETAGVVACTIIHTINF